MADADDAVVEFRCRRCQKLLSAPKSKVGTEGLCPQCQLTYVVPVQGTLDTGAEYDVVEGGGPAAAELEVFISVTCPTCQSHLQAREDQVGQTIACPDCETQVTVETPEPEEPPKEKPPVEEADLYALRKEPGETETEEPVAAEIIEEPATAESIEEPPPAPPQEPQLPPQEEPSEQRVRLSEMLPSKKPAEEPTPEEPKLFPVYCPLCNTLMHATADQAGQEIVCPDCQTATVVKIPKEGAKLDSSAFRVGADERYAAAPPKPVKRAEYRAGIDYRTDRPMEEVEEEERKREIVSVPDPPPRPLLAGVFDFPFRPDVWWRGLLLAAAALPMLLLFNKAYACHLETLGGHVAQGCAAFFGVPFFAAMGVFALLAWDAVFGPHFLAIVADVSKGIDKIEDWPGQDSAEWLNGAAVVLAAGVIGAAPGAAFAILFSLVGLPDWCGWLVTALTLWALFPFILLSIQAENSVVSPFSKTVWDSTTASRRWWGLFYAETIGLLLAAGGLLWGATFFVAAVGWVANFVHWKTRVMSAGWVGWIAFVGLVLVYGLLVYARLLGRLAWVCSAELTAEVPSDEVPSDEGPEDPNEEG